MGTDASTTPPDCVTVLVEVAAHDPVIGEFPPAVIQSCTCLAIVGVEIPLFFTSLCAFFRANAAWSLPKAVAAIVDAASNVAASAAIVNSKVVVFSWFFVIILFVHHSCRTGTSAFQSYSLV